MKREEYILGQGLTSDGDERTEIHTEEVWNGTNKGCGLHVNLILVTGNAHITICGIFPAELKRLGEFLIECADNTIIKRFRHE